MASNKSISNAIKGALLGIVLGGICGYAYATSLKAKFYENGYKRILLDIQRLSVSQEEQRINIPEDKKLEPYLVIRSTIGIEKQKDLPVDKESLQSPNK